MIELRKCSRTCLAMASSLAFALTACDIAGVDGVDDDETQTWEFTLALDGAPATTATASCLPGGACTAKSWTIQPASFGCLYKLDFGVQFSGDVVRLLTFSKTFDSTCDITTVGTGTGSANASYPQANQALGTVTLNNQSPIGPSSGTANWAACRISVCP